MPNAPVYHDPDKVSDLIRSTSQIPFWTLLGILCGLIILPRFWATRIFTLNLHASSLIVYYTIRFISTLVWKDHARYIPIYTETGEEILLHWVSGSRFSVAWLAHFLNAIRSVNGLCVLKFLWICSTPSGMTRVFDQVRLTHCTGVI